MLNLRESASYRWMTAGDINGFCGLMFDNLTVMVFLSSILVGFGFPKEFVFKHMLPGTALGVMFGDLVYTWLAIRLARRTNNPNVTAMPLGLDTPSSIGVALTVLGPAFLAYRHGGMDANQAALATWYMGMATMIYIGIVKVFFSFFGGWVQRAVPQAGLLGSLAGIGLALIGFLPLVDIFQIPVVGALSLGLILYTLIARIRLPGGLPGVAVAVIASTAIYYLLPHAWVGGGGFEMPKLAINIGIPYPTLGFVKGLHDALAYLPIAIPFGVLTVIGGINVTESARVAGDDYKTRDILMTEAVATLLAGVCGGVAQSTPYIGLPAYKSMGSRAGYTLITGLFIGLGGMLGYVPFFVDAIPRAVLAPILVFVALDIMVQANLACPPRYGAAVMLSYFPTIARMLWIKISSVVGDVGGMIGADPNLHDGFAKSYPDGLMTKLFAAPSSPLKELQPYPVINALGNGFIVTAMLWGGFVVHLIDRRLKTASVYLLVLAVLTYFGIIHSVTQDGGMYNPSDLPWNLQIVVYQFTGGYLTLAGLFFALSHTRESTIPLSPEEFEHPLG